MPKTVEQLVDEAKRRIRSATPDEVAASVLYLCGDQAAGVNGQALTIAVLSFSGQLGFGITGSLSNALIKLSVYAESQQDVFREHGKIGHPIDVVGVFGSAEFIIYFGTGVLFTAILDDPRPMLNVAMAVDGAAMREEILERLAQAVA